jgi:hypothetical protein
VQTYCDNANLLKHLQLLFIPHFKDFPKKAMLPSIQLDTIATTISKLQQIVITNEPLDVVKQFAHQASPFIPILHLLLLHPLQDSSNICIRSSEHDVGSPNNDVQVLRGIEKTMMATPTKADQPSILYKETKARVI